MHGKKVAKKEMDKNNNEETKKSIKKQRNGQSEQWQEQKLSVMQELHNHLRGKCDQPAQTSSGQIRNEGEHREKFVEEIVKKKDEMMAGDWEKFAGEVRAVAEQVLGRTSGKRKEDKEGW